LDNASRVPHQQGLGGLRGLRQNPRRLGADLSPFVHARNQVLQGNSMDSLSGRHLPPRLSASGRWREAQADFSGPGSRTVQRRRAPQRSVVVSQTLPQLDHGEEPVVPELHHARRSAQVRALPRACRAATEREDSTEGAGSDRALTDDGEATQQQPFSLALV